MNFKLKLTNFVEGLVLATKVHLTGPRHVERGEIFWVHCISGEKPVGQLAEFQIDGKTKDSIRLYQHACFSTKTRSECLTNECHCSKDGTSYSLRFAASSSKKTLELTCVMKFSQTQPVFIRETLQVTIMGEHILSIIIIFIIIITLFHDMKICISFFSFNGTNCNHCIMKTIRTP